MKPEDLKSPFSWNERSVLLRDRILYVPSYFDRYEEFKIPSWSHPDFFGNENPVNVEYCSGNGAWLIAKALENPHVNWIAVEKKFMRVRKIWSKMKNHQLKNLLIICGEAHTVTSCYFPARSLHHVFINFPDPWPKKKHAKHRLIKDEFVQELDRITVADGSFTFVTDDPDYSDETTQTLQRSAAFKSLHSNPCYTTDYPEYGTSYFDELWRSKGREIRYHCFRKD